MNSEKNTLRRDLRSWVWVFLCTAGIFATVPVARSFQKFINGMLGREFFINIVLFVVVALFAAIVFYFAVKLKNRNTSQYIWILTGAASYVYFTFQFRKHPEEAIHLLEYGLLSFFVFKALSCRIRDWTVYLSSAFIVSFIGAIDEFLQWLMPGRVWDFRDVNTNMIAGCIFLAVLWKGIKPEIINKPVKRYSIHVLAGILTMNLIFLGLCLSNTPDNVKYYTDTFLSLAWLRDEETMSNLVYDHSHISLKALWTSIAAISGLIWTLGGFWKRRI